MELPGDSWQQRAARLEAIRMGLASLRSERPWEWKREAPAAPALPTQLATPPPEDVSSERCARLDAIQQKPARDKSEEQIEPKRIAAGGPVTMYDSWDPNSTFLQPAAKSSACAQEREETSDITVHNAQSEANGILGSCDASKAVADTAGVDFDPSVTQAANQTKLPDSFIPVSRSRDAEPLQSRRFAAVSYDDPLPVELQAASSPSLSPRPQKLRGSPGASVSRSSQSQVQALLQACLDTEGQASSSVCHASAETARQIRSEKDSGTSVDDSPPSPPLAPCPLSSMKAPPRPPMVPPTPPMAPPEPDLEPVGWRSQAASDKANLHACPPLGRILPSSIPEDEQSLSHPNSSDHYQAAVSHNLRITRNDLKSKNSLKNSEPSRSVLTSSWQRQRPAPRDTSPLLSLSGNAVQATEKHDEETSAFPSSHDQAADPTGASYQSKIAANCKEPEGEAVPLSRARAATFADAKCQSPAAVHGKSPAPVRTPSRAQTPAHRSSRNMSPSPARRSASVPCEDEANHGLRLTGNALGQARMPSTYAPPRRVPVAERSREVQTSRTERGNSSSQPSGAETPKAFPPRKTSQGQAKPHVEHSTPSSGRAQTQGNSLNAAGEKQRASVRGKQRHDANRSCSDAQMDMDKSTSQSRAETAAKVGPSSCSDWSRVKAAASGCKESLPKSARQHASDVCQQMLTQLRQMREEALVQSSKVDRDQGAAPEERSAETCEALPADKDANTQEDEAQVPGIARTEKAPPPTQLPAGVAADNQLWRSIELKVFLRRAGVEELFGVLREAIPDASLEGLLQMPDAQLLQLEARTVSLQRLQRCLARERSRHFVGTIYSPEIPVEDHLRAEEELPEAKEVELLLQQVQQAESQVFQEEWHAAVITSNMKKRAEQDDTADTRTATEAEDLETIHQEDALDQQGVDLCEPGGRPQTVSCDATLSVQQPCWQPSPSQVAATVETNHGKELVAASMLPPASSAMCDSGEATVELDIGTAARSPWDVPGAQSNISGDDAVWQRPASSDQGMNEEAKASKQGASATMPGLAIHGFGEVSYTQSKTRGQDQKARQTVASTVGIGTQLPQPSSSTPAKSVKPWSRESPSVDWSGFEERPDNRRGRTEGIPPKSRMPSRGPRRSRSTPRDSPSPRCEPSDLEGLLTSESLHHQTALHYDLGNSAGGSERTPVPRQPPRPSPRPSPGSFVVPGAPEIQAMAVGQQSTSSGSSSSRKQVRQSRIHELLRSLQLQSLNSMDASRVDARQRQAYQRHINQRSQSPRPSLNSTGGISPALSMRRSRSFMDLVTNSSETPQLSTHRMAPVDPSALDSVVARLPLRQVESEEACTICLEVPSSGEVVTTLPCCHWYHTECIREWLLHSRLCPLCKAQAVPDECEM
eukprot:TRINITY_DN105538_c0_g1_i1.p1 TRINITY_DN105538_c0_g1~~TRINITY_DN105538_c0_g1_i1.p1  ORF type:complete len:1397 (+),score=232.54 TRINITY_DN105538_c0_g1_i1:26-4192(+)